MKYYTLHTNSRSITVAAERLNDAITFAQKWAEDGTFEHGAKIGDEVLVTIFCADEPGWEEIFLCTRRFTIKKKGKHEQND